jgi:hypothetical protein
MLAAECAGALGARRASELARDVAASRATARRVHRGGFTAPDDADNAGGDDAGGDCGAFAAMVSSMRNNTAGAFADDDEDDGDAGAPPAIELSVLDAAPADDAACWPVTAHWLRRVDVDWLKGGAPAPKIVRPIRLALIPDRVVDGPDAVGLLRLAVEVCDALAHQSDAVTNSYALRVALISHVFTVVRWLLTSSTAGRYGSL